MTAKEKAEDLVNKYYTLFPINDYSLAKTSSLIAVDEIIKICPYLDYNFKMFDLDTKNQPNERFVNFWEEVKQEINNLWK